MTGHPPTAVTLWAKNASAFRGGLIALGVVLLVATLAVLSWPRAVDHLLTSDLQHRVAATAPFVRDVRSSVHLTGITRGASYPAEKTAWDAVPESLTSLHAAMPEPLRSVLTPGRQSARSDPYATTGPIFNYHYFVSIEASPTLHSDARLVAGRWPAAFTPTFAPGVGAGDIAAIEPTDAPIEIVLSRLTAQRMGWKIGATRLISLGSPAAPQRLTLVGTVVPADASLDFWRIDPLRIAPALENLGDAGFKLTAVAWLNPAPWSAVQYTFSASSISTWFGVDPGALTASNVGEVQSQLARFVAQPPDPATRLRYATQLDESLSDYVAGAGSAQTLLLMLAAGPLAVSVAVVVLGIELLIQRRRHVLALLSARGASGARIRVSLALEGVAVSVPAVLLGAVGSLLIVPGPVDAGFIVAAVVCALVPPVAMAVLASPRDTPGRDLFSRWRWVVEVVVLVAAVLALVVLFQRGLTPSVGIAADPLVVVTPVLVCLAVCVLVLRVVPYLLAWLASVLRRGRGALALVGAVRSERTSAAALVPVLAVLTGIAVTVFSAVLFSTERTGVDEAARATVGSDISVSSSRLSTDEVARMRALDGVAALATVSSAGYANLSKDGTVEPVFVFETDAAALTRVQAGLPNPLRMPSLDASGARRAPIALGGWGDTGHAAHGILTLDADIRVRVATTTLTPGDFVTVAPWVLIDSHAMTSGFSSDAPVVTTALIRLDSADDSGRVVAQLRKIGGDDAVIHSAQTHAAAARQAPIVGGLEIMLPSALGIAVLLCVLALLATLVMNGRSRERLTATLRTLGLSRRQNVGLIAWEIAPIIAAGVIGGVAAGFALPFVVLSPLDLAAFTGGSAHPPIAIDGLTIVGALVGFVAICGVVTVAASALSARANAADILRTGEDE